MDKKQDNFWKGFLVGAICFFVIGALGVLGLTRLLQGIADRMSEADQARTESTAPCMTEEPSRPVPATPAQEGSSSAAGTSVPDPTEPAPYVPVTQPGPTKTPDTTVPTSKAPATKEPVTETPVTINRMDNVFLDRLGELQEAYDENQVMPYDMSAMETAALRAYVEAAGENWDEYENASPEYGPNVTVLPRIDSAFLNRMAEITELVDQRAGLTPAEKEECELSTLRGFVNAGGDVYSAYLTPKEWDSMQESSAGSYCGIGVQIQQDPNTMESTVVTVFSSSSAKEVGMLPGDIFKKVDGMDVTEMALELMVTYVRGEEHTNVTITVYRPLTDETLEFVCERRIVEVDTVYYRMLDAQVGYIQLTEFDEVSVTQVKKALNELKSQGMTKLIFDLRGNPGGLLSSVLEISDYFIEKGKTTFRMEYKNGYVYTEKALQAPIFDGAMIVLIDGGSASASEVMTGIMQDYGRAVIMGTQSFGKGIVQSFFSLSDGGMLKVTIAHYFSPEGRDFHGVGITPDIEGEDNVLTEEDELLDQALEQFR